MAKAIGELVSVQRGLDVLRKAGQTRRPLDGAALADKVRRILGVPLPGEPLPGEPPSGAMLDLNTPAPARLPPPSDN
jgi:hypothetical protein